MLTSFAFTFAQFFQPGIFWPELADFRPMQVIAILALLTSIKGSGSHSRMEVLRQPSLKWMLVFLFVQVLSVYDTGFAGMVTEFDATYFDIVRGERIVYAYEMHLDGRKISVSIATFEFKRSGAGAKLIMTEQGAFLDGYDDNASRERGSREIIEKLSAYLEGLQ